MAAPLSRRSLFRTVTALAVVLSASAACGSDTTAPSIVDADFAESLGVDLDASTRTASGLYYRDIVVGTGSAAQVGDIVTVGYTLHLVNGQHQQTGTYPFTIAAGAAIDGFVEGVIGMREGGSRQLIVPPHLGYGSTGTQTIPGNAILVFTIELQSFN